MKGTFYTDEAGTVILEPDGGERVVLPCRIRARYEVVPENGGPALPIAEITRPLPPDGEPGDTGEEEDKALPITERRLLLALYRHPRNTFQSFTQWMRAAGYAGQAPRTATGRDTLVELGYVKKVPRDMDTLYTLTHEGRLAAAQVDADHGNDL